MCAKCASQHASMERLWFHCVAVRSSARGVCCEPADTVAQMPNGCPICRSPIEKELLLINGLHNVHVLITVEPMLWNLQCRTYFDVMSYFRNTNIRWSVIFIILKPRLFIFFFIITNCLKDILPLPALLICPLFSRSCISPGPSFSVAPITKLTRNACLLPHAVFCFALENLRRRPINRCS